MPGSSPTEEVNRFLEALQLAASCLATTPFVVSHDARTVLGRTHSVATRRPITLRRKPLPDGEGGRSDLRLNLALEYEIVERDDVPRSERYKVSTRRYQHHLLDAEDGEVLLFHWHPTTGKASPHLHISSPGAGSPYTRRAHVPTGRVTVEAVVRLP